MYSDNEKFIKSKKPTKKGRRFFFIPMRENDRVLSASEKKYFKILNGELIVNVLLILLGIIVYFVEYKLNIWLGLCFIIYGLIKVWAFLMKNDINLFSYSIVYSVIAIVLGIVSFFVNSNIMLGLWLLLFVIENGELVVRLKIINDKSWNFILMVCVISLFMGILIMVNPFSNLSYSQVMGSFLILFGVLNCTKIFMLKSRSYNFV